MLISMPTGSSTIFGVFQLIRVSQVVWHDVRAGLNLGRPRPQRKFGGSKPKQCTTLTAEISLLDKAISLLDKSMRNTNASVRDGTVDSGGKENRGIVLSTYLFSLRHSFRGLRGHPCDHHPQDHSLPSLRSF
jgi:hypothetical protein